MIIVGRKYEKDKLEKVFASNEPEFVAVYGRRRVGKTYLIREFFAGKECIFFRNTGINNADIKTQLDIFKREIEVLFYAGHPGITLAPFTNWHDAFLALKSAIDLFGKNQKIVIFLDEVPWMATQKSGFLEALDYFWNRYCVSDNRIKLIICGSAASWVIDNILHNTGGLHNRVTLRLLIAPFSLYEVKEYLKFKGINYNDSQILTLYMCLGGIPFYLNAAEKGLSAIQNINNACFIRKGTLFDEFDLLFDSLFKKNDKHKEIIIFLSQKREGTARSEIEAKFEYKGGRLTKKTPRT
jgi:predicted AAA+ superfamily ATPase